MACDTFRFVFNKQVSFRIFTVLDLFIAPVVCRSRFFKLIILIWTTIFIQIEQILALIYAFYCLRIHIFLLNKLFTVNILRTYQLSSFFG
jgi:hypothetical protein